jgi:DNA-binding transcriptional ArsR family regulator
MILNMKTTRFEKKAGKLFSVMGNPFRIKILLSIGKGEACVCHLEALFGKRQAYISQHLMALRKEGLLETRREGKYIFYRLTDLDTIDLIRKAGELAGLEEDQVPELVGPDVVPKCPCPKCESKVTMQASEIHRMDLNDLDRMQEEMK